jgi:hypothetical protein
MKITVLLFVVFLVAAVSAKKNVVDIDDTNLGQLVSGSWFLELYLA